jgi:hypothetical protein
MVQTRNVDIRNGMALDRAELDALQVAGVRAQARITPVSQTNGNYVLRGEESGGGTKSLGHYVGFVPLAGIPFIFNRKLTALGANSIHRRIIASVMIRFEVFRYRDNFVHAFITLHRAGTGNGRKVPMTRQTLFRGKYGEIDKSGNVTFPSEDGGEDISIPSFLMPGFQAALMGTRCIGTSGAGCQHASHFESVGNVRPEAIISALHIAVPGISTEQTTKDVTASIVERQETTAAA